MSNNPTPCLVKRITSRAEQENRRRLGMQLILEGRTIREVADVLKVSSRSVDYWISWYNHQKEAGLAARKHPGPKPKLTDEQTRTVCSWLTRDATEFGFRTNLWTSTRIVQLIKEKFSI